MAHLLTIAEIKTQYRADWEALSPQQATFLTELISGSIGNGLYSPLDAGKVAYPNMKNPQVWAGRLLKNKKVDRILQLHSGLSETRAILFDVKALLKRSRRKGAKLDLLVPYWIRVAAALEAIAAKGNVA